MFRSPLQLEQRSRTEPTAFTEAAGVANQEFQCSVIKLCRSTICNIRSPRRSSRYYNLLSVRIRQSDGSMCNSFSKICEWICGDLLFILTTRFCPRWGRGGGAYNRPKDQTSDLLITRATVLQPQLINNVA